MLLSRWPRTVRRLLARYRAEGVACVVHGSTGRVPVNKTPQEVREAIVELAELDGTYHTFNACHLQELLEERHGIRIGRSTLDRLLSEERLRRRRRNRRSKRLHRWRERRACAGDMLLVDGSPFRWLGGREGGDDPICLLGCMDDATGAILHLRFWPTECQAGYITMLRDVAVKPVFCRHFADGTNRGMARLIFGDSHAKSYSAASILAQEKGANLHWWFR